MSEQSGGRLYYAPAPCSTCGAKSVTRTANGPSCHDCLDSTKILRLQERVTELEAVVADLRGVPE